MHGKWRGRGYALKTLFFPHEDKDNVKGMFSGSFSLLGKKLVVKEDEFEA